jgi:TPR repeat protein
MFNTIALLFVAYVLPSTADTIPAVDYAVAYQACTEEASKHSADITEALKKCEEPALQGVPGAQYVMGALLTNRNAGTDRAAGVEWLEKAIVAGSPAAAFHLGSILASSKDEKSIDRGRELFKAALCAGYPLAVRIFEKESVSKTSVPCPSTADTDFSGDWILSMKWDKKAPTGAGAEDY